MSVTVVEPPAPDDTPSGAAGVTLALPLRLDGAAFATVEQGSPAELGQSVRLALSTRPGERSCAQEYGTPDYTFTLNGTITAGGIEANLAELEPRANVDVGVEQVGARAHITVNVVPEEV